MKTRIKLGIIGAISVILIILSFQFFDATNIEGDEVGVVHSFVSGVQEETEKPGVSFVMFGKIHKINIGTQKMTFSDMEDSEVQAIKVNCGADGGQEARIALTINYSLDPNYVIRLYNDGLAYTYQDIVLKRTAIEVVNQIARPQEALEIFSGEGFNNLKIAVDETLKNHTMLKNRGIIVQNALVYDVNLDEKYEDEIAAKQLAKQQKLTEDEKTKAATAMVLRIRAEAQAEVEQRTAKAEASKIEEIKKAEAAKQQVILKAEADKEQVVLKAQADKEQVVLAAQAEKEQMTLEGEGIKLRDTAKADGVRAVGLAEAEVEKAKRDAMYEGEAGLRRANVEIAEAMADRLKGILDGVNVIPDKALVSLGVTSPGLVVDVDKQ
jgi:regulator of protease activity HflC (stomatin/prohibitin superfamily)